MSSWSLSKDYLAVLEFRAKQAAAERAGYSLRNWLGKTENPFLEFLANRVAAVRDRRDRLNRGPTTVEPPTDSPTPPDPGPRPSPYAVLVDGSRWIDPERDCREREHPDGRRSLHCEGPTAEFGALVMLGIALTGGILGLVNWLSKSPKPVTLDSFPHPGEDQIDVRQDAVRTPGTVRFTLDTSKEMWLKVLDFQLANEKSKLVISTQGTRRTQFMEMPEYLLDSPGCRLVLGKAKFLGILTQMYVLKDLSGLKGSDWTFYWVAD